MAETIESFVAKLQKEGVDAGEEAAKKISDEARAEADRIVADARKEAEKIIADAKANENQIVERASMEMGLAARDVASRLRETLTASLNEIIAMAAGKTLEDIEFLKSLILEIVLLYARADKEGNAGITINVSKDMMDKLESWSINELKKELTGESGVSLDIKGTLGQAGFEYEVSGGTIEITRDAVVETLCTMISPVLGEVLQQKTGEGS